MLHSGNTTIGAGSTLHCCPAIASSVDSAKTKDYARRPTYITASQMNNNLKKCGIGVTVQRSNILCQTNDQNS